VVKLWLSPTDMMNPPVALALIGAGALLLVLILPFFIQQKAALGDCGRGLTYFGIGWPLLATVPLMGAAEHRHFYLASVGLAVALD
jgi:hypothetical protein